uniref:Uncharacterized protein n=1 Tax=Arundo donax TaxID=35708 RepID=A0A0A9HYF4_ARUDO
MRTLDGVCVRVIWPSGLHATNAVYLRCRLDRYDPSWMYIDLWHCGME